MFDNAGDRLGTATHPMHVSVSWKRRHKPPEEAVERALAWLGRFVILASFPVAAFDNTLFGSPLLTLVMLALYVGYVVVWWPALTRRAEVAALAAGGLALAALYMGAAIPLWGA